MPTWKKEEYNKMVNQNPKGREQLPSLVYPTTTYPISLAITPFLLTINLASLSHSFSRVDLLSVELEQIPLYGFDLGPPS